MKPFWNNFFVIKPESNTTLYNLDSTETIVLYRYQDIIFDGWIFRCSKCNDEMRSSDATFLIGHVQKHLKTHNLNIGNIIIYIK